MLFRKNPEFLKNLWIEISPTRLIVMPIILGLIFYGTYLANLPTTYNPNQGIESLIYSAIICFILIVFVWGGKLSSDTIISEVNNRTWLNQRISAISPWQMTTGKLFGSTIYTWYGGFICGLVMLVIGIQTPYFQLIAQLLVSLILGGFFIQGFILNLTLLSLKKTQDQTANYNGIFYLIFSLFIIIFLFSPLLSSFNDLFYTNQYSRTKYMIWFHQKVTIFSFYNLSGVLFVIWVLIGVYQNIRSEFQFKNKSLVWILFTINFILYLFGFLFNDKNNNWFESSLLSLVFCTGLFYFLLFAESKDFVYLQILKKHLQEKNWKQLNFKIPLWLVLFPFLLLLSLINIITTSQNVSIVGIEKNHIWFPLNFILFICRDIFLILWVSISNYRRKELTIIVFLGLLYILFPVLTFLITNSEQSFAIFFPVFAGNYGLETGILPISLQFIVIAIIFVSRWKKLVKVI